MSPFLIAGVVVLGVAGCGPLFPAVGLGGGQTRITRDAHTLVVEFPDWKMTGRSTAFLCPTDPGGIETGADGVVRVPLVAGCVPSGSFAGPNGVLIKFSLDTLKAAVRDRFDRAGAWFIAIDVVSDTGGSSALTSIPGGPIGP